MIVVMIIGLLAAVAIPSFVSYQARSRRSEAYVNLGAIARSEKAYQAAQGDYHDSSLPWPDPDDYGGLGRHKMDWDSDSDDAFARLGWAPEGQVFYGYHTNATQSCSCTLCFTATAYGDVDGDGKISAVMYVEPQRFKNGGVSGECRSGMPDELDFGTPTSLGSGEELFSTVAIQRVTDEY